ncbi:MAG: hypothetical protein KAY48_04780 [Saprospiraceae bacterium]|nr:hypothetical protein [Saprospiraceae bacterium]
MNITARQNEQDRMLRNPVNIGLQDVLHNETSPIKRQMNVTVAIGYDHDKISL